VYEYGGIPQNDPPVITDVLPGNTSIFADGGAGWNEISCSSTISDEDSETYYITWDFGIEYVTDGTMEANPTVNWSSNNATLAVETTTKRTGSNSLKVIDTGTFGCAYETITTEVGAKYRFEAYAYLPSELVLRDTLIFVGTTLTNQDLGYAYITAEDAWTYGYVDFVATATTTYVAMEVRGYDADGSDWAFWDDVRVRQISTVEDPGTITIPDPGSYPTEYTVTVDSIDDLGGEAEQQSFTVNVLATDPGGATPEVGSIAGTDGTYGIDNLLIIRVNFVDDNGDPIDVTLTDTDTDEVDDAEMLLETGDDDLKLKHYLPALGTPASTHYFHTTADAGYKIIAGMVSADLSVTSITDGDDTFNADLTIEAGENLSDHSAIVIDATATSLSIAVIALCDSDGVPLGENTTNSTSGKVYASITLAGSELGFFNNGPISDLGMPLALSNGTCVFRYASTQPSGWGVGHNEWLFEGVLEIGDRDDASECVLDGSAMTRPLGTKIIDGGSNELSDYDWPDTDILSGFTWRVSIPYPSTSPKEFDATNTIAAWILAGGYFVSDDFAECIAANSIGTVDLSAYDGTSGHQITIDGGGFADDGVQTYGDYYTIKRMIK